MNDHETERKDGVWGVSHNGSGLVIMRVCSYACTDRVLLTQHEARTVAESLTRMADMCKTCKDCSAHDSPSKKKLTDTRAYVIMWP